MVKVSKDFFKDGEVLFVGYSSRNNGYSKSIYQAFTNNQMKVYPYNTKENATFDIKVYKKLAELPTVPKNAFILLNKENTAKAVNEVIGKGIKRILFHSAKNVDAATLEKCEKAGIETAAGCPMMVYGTGIHKLHAFFAGVK
ncbi:MAG: CoA-binding protein [Mobilitalea sp.]